MALALRRWHRRISLLIGLQLLAWTASGLVFSWWPIAEVRGETSLVEVAAPPAPDGARLRAGLERLLTEGVALEALALEAHRGAWAWRLREAGAAEGETRWLDLEGRPLAPLDEAGARALALARTHIDGAPTTVERLEQATGEYRGRALPAWRVSFDDPLQHAVYVDAGSGEVTAVRHDRWRLFDWFWMLHIMDYEERSDFSTPLLTGAALLGLLSALSGLALGLARPWRRRRTGSQPFLS